MGIIFRDIKTGVARELYTEEEVAKARSKPTLQQIGGIDQEARKKEIEAWKEKNPRKKAEEHVESRE